MKISKAQREFLTRLTDPRWERSGLALDGCTAHSLLKRGLVRCAPFAQDVAAVKITDAGRRALKFADMVAAGRATHNAKSDAGQP